MPAASRVPEQHARDVFDAFWFVNRANDFPALALRDVGKVPPSEARDFEAAAVQHVE